MPWRVRLRVDCIAGLQNALKARRRGGDFADVAHESGQRAHGRCGCRLQQHQGVIPLQSKGGVCRSAPHQPASTAHGTAPSLATLATGPASLHPASISATDQLASHSVLHQWDARQRPDSALSRHSSSATLWGRAGQRGVVLPVTGSQAGRAGYCTGAVAAPSVQPLGWGTANHANSTPSSRWLAAPGAVAGLAEPSQRPHAGCQQHGGRAVGFLLRGKAGAPESGRWVGHNKAALC